VVCGGNKMRRNNTVYKDIDAIQTGSLHLTSKNKRRIRTTYVQSLKFTSGGVCADVPNLIESIQ
jgi:hypothetical protein